MSLSWTEEGMCISSFKITNKVHMQQKCVFGYSCTTYFTCQSIKPVVVCFQRRLEGVYDNSVVVFL